MWRCLPAGPGLSPGFGRGGPAEPARLDDGGSFPLAPRAARCPYLPLCTFRDRDLDASASSGHCSRHWASRWAVAGSRSMKPSALQYIPPLLTLTQSLIWCSARPSLWTPSFCRLRCDHYESRRPNVASRWNTYLRRNTHPALTIVAVSGCCAVIGGVIAAAELVVSQVTESPGLRRRNDGLWQASNPRGARSCRRRCRASAGDSRVRRGVTTTAAAAAA